jgi:hypothetical protein
MPLPQDFWRNLPEKTEAELYDMLDHAYDWQPDALDAAKQELQKRGLPPQKTSRTRDPSHSGQADSPITKRRLYTWNGTGTRFRGERDLRTDGSFLTTEWIVFCNIPMIPLRTVRVIYLGGEQTIIGATRWFEVLEVRKPDLRDCSLLLVYLWAIATLALWTACVALLIHLIDTSSPSVVAKRAQYLLGFIAFFGPIGLAAFLRRYYERRKPPA